MSEGCTRHQQQVCTEEAQAPNTQAGEEHKGSACLSTTRKEHRDEACAGVFQHYSLCWWDPFCKPSRGGISTAWLTAVLSQSQKEPFLRATFPRATDSQEACSELIRGLGEPQAKCTSHHSTKSRLGGKVGMTTIYKQPKSVHTSGNGGITVRGNREHSTCPPHVCTALHKLGFLLLKLSISRAACYSKQALCRTAPQQSYPKRGMGRMATSRRMKSWIRKKEQQEKFPDTLLSAVGITSQRKW